MHAERVVVDLFCGWTCPVMEKILFKYMRFLFIVAAQAVTGGKLPASLSGLHCIWAY